MNTNKLMDWLGGGWRGELGQDPKNSTPNEEIALRNANLEVPDHDCKQESCKVCLDYLGEAI